MTLPIPSNLDSLIGLSRRHGVDIKPTLLRVLTDLYIQKPTHSPDEASQYTALALRLLDVVDAPTLAIVKQKLAAYPGAPEEVLRHLFGDDLELAKNSQTRNAPPHGDAHQRPLGGGITALALTAAFFAAESTERRLILAKLDHADATATELISSGERDKAIGRLEQAALGTRPGEIARELERTLKIPREIAQTIVNDPSGEPIVVAAKALGMPLAVLQRILLFVNPAIGHSVRRVYDLSALFEDISPQSACQLVAVWRDQAAETARSPSPQAERDRARRVREPTTTRERPSAIDIDEDLFLDRPQRAG